MLVIYRNKCFHVYEKFNNSNDFEMGYEIMSLSELDDFMKLYDVSDKNEFICQKIIDYLNNTNVVDTLGIIERLNAHLELMNYEKFNIYEIINTFFVNTHYFKVFQVDNGCLIETNENILSKKIMFEITKYVCKFYLSNVEIDINLF